jgi:hypothetical protein
MPSDCFADEIAIDFPSVDSAVERIRAAFLGVSADDVVRAELPVTAREARGGRVIPIEVPVPALCEPCGGRGETWTEPCAACRGTGAAVVHHQLRVTLPPKVMDGTCIRFRVSLPGAPPVRIELRVAIQPANREIG